MRVCELIQRCMWAGSRGALAALLSSASVVPGKGGMQARGGGPGVMAMPERVCALQGEVVPHDAGGA